jgi:DNA-binding response OmpR family regulator
VAARIRAVLRRVDGGPAAVAETRGPLEAGALTVDSARRSATHAGEELDLTRKEFELLELLVREAGNVVSRERLMDEVWDVNWFGSTKTLDVHISSLRRKLGDESADPRYIHTVRGVGFRFAAPDELQEAP